MPETPTGLVSIGYVVEDVAEAVYFHTRYLGFTVHYYFAPGVADVVRGRLRLEGMQQRAGG
jgi:hypothetical protein